MSSESRIWEIRPFGSMRGGRALVIGLWASQSILFRLLYETEMAGIKTAEYAEQRNRKRTVNLTADGRELTQILTGTKEVGMKGKRARSGEPGVQVRESRSVVVQHFFRVEGRWVGDRL